MKMIIKLTLYLLVAFIPSFIFAQSSECTIQLNSGDTLSGNLLASNSEKLKLSISNFDDQALEVPQKDIKKLWFNNRINEGLTRGEHVILLSNGDIIYGKLLKLNLETVSFHSDFLGIQTIPRSSVAIITKANRKKITYLGPIDLSTWEVISGKWEIQKGTFTNTTKNSEIFKNFNLSPHSQIDISLADNKNNKFTINFFADDINTENYQLLISKKKFFLIKNGQVKNKPLAWGSIKATGINKISLVAELKTGKLALKVNDVIIQKIAKHEPLFNPGKGISIVSQFPNLKIHEIKITDHLQTEIDIDGFKVTNNTEKAILDQSNTYTGTVTQADNEELKIELGKDQLQAFKTDKITWLSLEARQTPPSSKAARVFLKNNAGLMHIEITKMTNRLLHGMHHSLGEVEIPYHNIGSIIFTPQK